MHLIANSLLPIAEYETPRVDACSFLPKELFAKQRLNRFLIGFANLRYLMQIHILFRAGNLHQTAKIGEIAKKRSAEALQKALKLSPCLPFNKCSEAPCNLST